MTKKRKICFVTGTRAEFGLMESTLRAIRDRRDLQLQIVVTGMHLNRRYGKSVDEISAGGWKIDAQVPWDTNRSDSTSQAIATGHAIASMATCFARLKSDIVLVVGDRVEAFAAASAAHIARKIVAHVHGGDRALGQVDDSLRHAITKLSHIHFPATRQSAARLMKMGEDAFRIHRVGSPGIDGIDHLVERGRRPLSRLVLVALHPTDAVDSLEYQRAKLLAQCIKQSGIEHAVVVYPNSDPGNVGITRYWDELAQQENPNWKFARNLPRQRFLLLLSSCAMLVGNSSSGIIEAASFGAPVINIGPRQQGRERGGNVTDVAWERRKIEQAIRSIWNDGKPRRYSRNNPYGGGATGLKIAGILGRISMDSRISRKIIAY